ncbi:MAG: response regulator [Holophagales bacterium]|nr:response regulator [Holophagales bacterium]
MAIKILLADDSLTIQKVVELTFSDAETRLMAVGSGDRAVQALDDFQPDIVLADVVMPGLTGYDVCEAVKRRSGGPFVPVVLLTGTFEPFDRARAERVGSDAIVTKPFDSHALQGLVRDLVTRARAARQDAETAALAAPPPAPEPPPTMILSVADLEAEIPPPAPGAEDMGATQSMQALDLKEALLPPFVAQEQGLPVEDANYRTMAMKIPTPEELAAAAPIETSAPPPPPPPAFFEPEPVAVVPPPSPAFYEPEPISLAPPPPSPFYRPELVPSVEPPPAFVAEPELLAAVEPPPPLASRARLLLRPRSTSRNRPSCPRFLLLRPPSTSRNRRSSLRPPPPPPAALVPEPTAFIPPPPPPPPAFYEPESILDAEPPATFETRSVETVEPFFEEAGSPEVSVPDEEAGSPFAAVPEPEAVPAAEEVEVAFTAEATDAVALQTAPADDAAFELPAEEPVPQAEEPVAAAAVAVEEPIEPFPEMDEPVLSSEAEAAPWDEGPVVEIPPPPPELSGAPEDTDGSEPVTRDIEADLEAFEASGRVRRRPEIWERHAALIGEETPTDIDMPGSSEAPEDVSLPPMGEPTSSELEEMAAAARLEDLSALIPAAPAAAVAKVAPPPRPVERQPTPRSRPRHSETRRGPRSPKPMSTGSPAGSSSSSRTRPSATSRGRSCRSTPSASSASGSPRSSGPAEPSAVPPPKPRLDSADLCLPRPAPSSTNVSIPSRSR